MKPSKANRIFLAIIALPVVILDVAMEAVVSAYQQEKELLLEGEPAEEEDIEE